MWTGPPAKVARPISEPGPGDSGCSTSYRWCSASVWLPRPCGRARPPWACRWSQGRPAEARRGRDDRLQDGLHARARSHGRDDAQDIARRRKLLGKRELARRRRIYGSGLNARRSRAASRDRLAGIRRCRRPAHSMTSSARAMSV